MYRSRTVSRADVQRRAISQYAFSESIRKQTRQYKEVPLSLQSPHRLTLQVDRWLRLITFTCIGSLLGSLSEDDDDTAIKCRVSVWRRVTFQTTTTTAEKQLNLVSVKRGVGVYLFSFFF